MKIRLGGTAMMKSFFKLFRMGLVFTLICSLSVSALAVSTEHNSDKDQAIEIGTQKIVQYY